MNGLLLSLALAHPPQAPVPPQAPPVRVVVVTQPRPAPRVVYYYAPPPVTYRPAFAPMRFYAPARGCGPGG
jgi:hypothetical protein